MDRPGPTGAADKRSRTIIIDFGKRIAWLGLDRDSALSFVELLMERIKELGGDA